MYSKRIKLGSVLIGAVTLCILLYSMLAFAEFENIILINSNMGGNSQSAQYNAQQCLGQYVVGETDSAAYTTSTGFMHFWSPLPGPEVISGPVFGIWISDSSPYNIIGEVWIPEDSTLIIEPGVEVIFQGHYKFYVYGYLEAVGSESDSILFTATNPDPGWHGIRFINAPDSSHLSYCIIEYGRAIGTGPDYRGGGIYCDSSSNPVISHCTIRNNSTVGGTGGGIACYNESNPTISHCVITGNSSGWGGGLHCATASPLIEHCTISGNAADTLGGGIRLNGSSATIVNTIIEGNTGYGGIYFTSSSTTSVTYGDFWDNQNGNFLGAVPSGLGVIDTINANGDPCDAFFNILLDPVFYTTTGDSAFYLTEDSPCIDAGDPSYPRDPDNTIADIGAFYFHQPDLPSIVVFPSPLDFGPVQLNQQADLPLYITNIGGDTLILDSIFTSDPCFITDFNPVNNQVEPFDTLTLAVSFTPDSILVYDEILTILNNDSTVCVSLQGRGGNGPVIVTLTPYNTPIVIPPGGDSFDFNIAAENTASFTVNFEIWTLATLPNGTQYGPLLGPVNLTLAGGASINRDRTQTVPAGAPVGNYLYNAYTGFYPFEIWWTDNFLFTKSGTGDGDGLQGWFCEGELFPEEGLNTRPLPEEFALSGAYPNPFNPVTNFDMALPEAAKVHFAVYDISGRLVATLMDGWRDAGYHRVTFNRSDLASGVYLYRLKAGTFTARGKMVMVK